MSIVVSTDERLQSGPRVESVGQSAAGAFVLAVAIAELMLGFWAAGWWQRSAALLVATVGAACLAHGLRQLVAPASR